MTVKVGDILLNEWASEDNPVRISLVLKKVGQYVFCWYINDNGKEKRLSQCRYYASHIKENKDNKYHIIGHCDFITQIREALQKAKEMVGEDK